MRREHIVRVLSAQIFFFVRNLGHHHQHHNPATDTIVDLYILTPPDDVNWRLNTLYSMYRSVIEYKRNPHSSTFSDCLGILAYAATFRGICSEELGREAARALPVFYGENTADSIKAMQSRTERDSAIRQRRQDLIRNTLLAVLSIVLSFTGLLRLTDIQLHDVAIDTLLLRVIVWTIKNAVLSIVLFALFVVGMIIISNVRYRGVMPPLVTNILRLTQALRRPIAAGIYFAAGVALVWVMLRILNR